MDLLEDSDNTLRKPSTKRPLAKRQKRMVKVAKEDLLIDQALSALQSKVATPEDGDDIFGKNVACSLKKINDEQTKEYAKLKIQEILFQARCGALSREQMLSSAQNRLPIFNNQSFPVNQMSYVHPVCQSPQSPTYSYPSQAMQSKSPSSMMYE